MKRIAFAHVFFSALVGFLATLLVGAIVTGCVSAMTEAEVETAAERKYGAQQKACVAEAGTLAESRACRARVDLAWGITHAHPGAPGSMLSLPAELLDGGPRDAGQDGAP